MNLPNVNVQILNDSIAVIFSDVNDNPFNSYYRTGKANFVVLKENVIVKDLNLQFPAFKEIERMIYSPTDSLYYVQVKYSESDIKYKTFDKRFNYIGEK